jgi:ribosome maturation factor RimP
VEQDKVRLDVDGTEVLIPLADIETANIVYDWERDNEQ